MIKVFEIFHILRLMAETSPESAISVSRYFSVTLKTILKKTLFIIKGALYSRVVMFHISRSLKGQKRKINEHILHYYH